MVAEKRGDKVHDFLTDPITTIADGDWVKADGTTLELTTVSMCFPPWRCCWMIRSYTDR